MRATILSFLIILLFSCKNQKIDIIDTESEFLERKIETIHNNLLIKLAINQEKTRFFYNTSKKIDQNFIFLKSITQNENNEQLQIELKNVKTNLLSDSIFKNDFLQEIIEYRLDKWLNKNKVVSNKKDIKLLQWDLLNLEYEVQAYILNSVYSGHYKFNSIKPFVIEIPPNSKEGKDYSKKILLGVQDTTIGVSVIIADLSHPSTYFINKEDSSLVKLEIKNGIGYIPRSMKQFKNKGFKGVFRFKNHNGNIINWTFEHKP